jgi:hypothetical protein
VKLHVYVYWLLVRIWPLVGDVTAIVGLLDAGLVAGGELVVEGLVVGFVVVGVEEVLVVVGAAGAAADGVLATLDAFGACVVAAVDLTVTAVGLL